MALSIYCGTDLISIVRITGAVERLGQPFLDKIWTASEQEDCRCRQTAAGTPGSGSQAGLAPYWASLAARFAAKEAAAKALGTGVGRAGIRWLDLVVIRQPDAAPVIQLQGAALAAFKRLGGQSIALSMTHDAGLAQAVCVILADAGTAEVQDTRHEP
jgi:holo-[acyl-carrier protein] synthase